MAELLIATAVISIIMLGIVSADYAMQKFYKTSSTGAVSGFNTIAMINNIYSVAFGAVGTAADLGIKVDPSIFDSSGGGASTVIGNQTFCIRTAQGPDSWECYTKVAGTPDNLYRCTKAAAGVCTNTDTYVAPINSMTAKFVPNSAVSSQRLVFTFTLTVPDTDTTTKIYTTSVTPPNHRL